MARGQGISFLTKEFLSQTVIEKHVPTKGKSMKFFILRSPLEEMILGLYIYFSFKHNLVLFIETSNLKKLEEPINSKRFLLLIFSGDKKILFPEIKPFRGKP